MDGKELLAIMTFVGPGSVGAGLFYAGYHLRGLKAALEQVTADTKFNREWLLRLDDEKVDRQTCDAAMQQFARHIK